MLRYILPALAAGFLIGIKPRKKREFPLLMTYELSVLPKHFYPMLAPLRNRVPRKGGIQANWKAVTVKSDDFAALMALRGIL